MVDTYNFFFYILSLDKTDIFNYCYFLILMWSVLICFGPIAQLEEPPAHNR